ncbi:hypothetical protein [Poritiphilus flavus]|uniref:Gliding motility-associated protein GldM N-terminal domain-containing protein n=1 Tax=Poritiphilus flavus TaxID=2697053 RepID=A0A6L9EB18_9FLAO|nr:hypothetical protein [Poritiphilus flavus]NAS11957.1 hypothetical protein [Poritiphilus flavus]
MSKVPISLLMLSIILACNVKQSKGLEENNKYATYGLLTEELEAYNSFLRQQINKRLQNDSTYINKSHKIYDSLTIDYQNFLSQTIDELMNGIDFEKRLEYAGELSRKDLINNYFFEETEYSSIGFEFIDKTENYRNQILNLVTDDLLADKLTFILSTRNLQNRKGEMIKYLDYFYKDMPLIATIMYLQHKQTTLSELELDFICRSN